MSRDKKRLYDYLNHILDAINRINNYVEDIIELLKSATKSNYRKKSTNQGYHS